MFVLREFEWRVLERLCLAVLRRFSFGAFEGRGLEQLCLAVLSVWF